MYSEAVMAVDLEVGYKAQEVYVGLVAGHFRFIESCGY